MAHDVFISYASPDKVVADAVCATLEAGHIRCWIAPRDVLPGESFAQCLVNAIHNARVFVLVFSAATNSSVQVERELDRAVSSRLAILPLRVEDVLPRQSIEYYLAGQHWLDAITPPFEDHLARLSEAIVTLLSRPTGAPAETAPMATAPTDAAPETPSVTPPSKSADVPPITPQEATQAPLSEPTPAPGRAVAREPVATRPPVEARPRQVPAATAAAPAPPAAPVAPVSTAAPETARVPPITPQETTQAPVTARPVGRATSRASAVRRPMVVAAAVVGTAWIVILLVVDLLSR